MLTTSYPRSLGDISGIFIYRLCKALAVAKIQVDVVAPADQGASLQEERGGVRVSRFRYFFPERMQRLAYGPGGIPANLSLNPWLIFQVPFFILMFLIKAFRVVKGADLVHAQWIHTGLIAVMLRMVLGTPFVVTLRGSDILFSEKGMLASLLSRSILKRAALITTVSQDLRNWVIANDIPEKRVIFLRNGVELYRLKRNKTLSRTCALLYVGSLVQNKGVHYLLEALSRLIRQEPEIHLVVVGEGSEKKRLQDQAEDHGLNNAVTFAGTQPPDQIPEWMNRADCLVLPSLSEGTPNVVLEAMACGLPVVASSLPGICEVIRHGVHGLLSKPEDVDGLTNHLRKIVQNKALRLEMGERGRNAIIEMGLGWDQVARRYQEVYKQICAASQESAI